MHIQVQEFIGIHSVKHLWNTAYGRYIDQAQL